MSPIDVVVVSFNSAQFLPRLARGIKTCEAVRSVHVVDNMSMDDSAELAEGLDWGAPVFVSRMTKNVGFGMAVNHGALGAQADAPHILVVNPDVELAGDVVRALALELDSQPRRAAIGTILTTSNGAPVSSARDFPSVRSIVTRRPIDVDPGGRVVDADWLCGAFMLWQRAAFEAVDGFSSEYFLYFEDVDVCRKAREAGWSLAIDGRHRVVHDQGHGVAPSRVLQRESRRSRRRYARKWLGPKGVAATAIADCLDGTASVARRWGLR